MLIGNWIISRHGIYRIVPSSDIEPVTFQKPQPAAILVGVVGRLVFWAGFLYIIGHAVLASYRIGDFLTLVLKLVFFPLTYFIYPFLATGLWWVWLVSLGGYMLSTFVGKMPALE